MVTSKHVICWFEIPATDIERASKFYGTVLGKTLQSMEFGTDCKMSIFQSGAKEGEDIVHGAIAQGKDYKPGATGPLVYFAAGEDLAPALARVEKAGGKILQPKTPIGPYGFMAIIKDTEGNRVALHSRK